MANPVQPPNTGVRIRPVIFDAFPASYQEEIILLHKFFEENGYELRFSGGAARDMLLGIRITKLKFTTTATPAQMIRIFQRENITRLDRNPESHGRVAIRMNNTPTIKITSLRRCITPEGSCAGYDFTDEWWLEAARRDFTVNSLFVRLDLSNVSVGRDEQMACDDRTVSEDQHSDSSVQGDIYDYFGGVDDLLQGRIRFVGDPSARICEDHLRILRYFRFHGRFAKPPELDIHDDDILKVISENASGLSGIDSARCWAEFKRILCFPSTPVLLQRMSQAGILSYLGFPRTAYLTELTSAWNQGMLNLNPNPVTCLAKLLPNSIQASRIQRRLKFSRHERKLLAYIIKYRDRYAQFTRNNSLEPFQRELLLSNEPRREMRDVLGEMMRYLNYDAELLSRWHNWEPPVFPVTWSQLHTKWSIPHQSINVYLSVLRQQWVDSYCTLSRDQLLSRGNLTVVKELVTRVQPEPVR
ncbi:unnamed protein product [Dicrocoelium dendriticum]|nr:unnamed protein product [Dicrocoelium dendriticum]